MTTPKCTGEIDKKYWVDNFVIGTDEAGRGPIAGDMFIAAVCFSPDIDFISEIGLNDSKKLTSKRRFLLEESIKSAALAYSVRRVTIKTIDKDDSIQTLWNQCVRVTVRDVAKKLNNPDNIIVLVDGNIEVKGLSYKQIAKPKLDTVSWSVAAASILAKNAQVRSMHKWHEKYPEYEFDMSHGYGTEEHIKYILKYGTCEAHRKSWITKAKIDKWKEQFTVKKKGKTDRPRPKPR